MASTTIVYLLTAHPEAKEKVQMEIEEVMGDREDISEEDLGNLAYLDQVELIMCRSLKHFQVVCEGVRMVSVFYTFRECVKPYKVPGTALGTPYPKEPGSSSPL